MNCFDIIVLHLRSLIIFGFFLLIASSCSKGYEVRFTNYYTEPMDSVIVGNDAVIFSGVKTESSTDYKKIGKGNHSVRFVTDSKKVFYSTFDVAGSGSGKKTIQVDAIQQVSILED